MDKIVDFSAGYFFRSASKNICGCWVNKRKFLIYNDADSIRSQFNQATVFFFAFPQLVFGPELFGNIEKDTMSPERFSILTPVDTAMDFGEKLLFVFV